MNSRRLYFKSVVQNEWFQTSQIDPWQPPWVIYVDSVPEGETMASGVIEARATGTLHPYGQAWIKVQQSDGSIVDLWTQAGNGVTGTSFDSGTVVVPDSAISFWMEFNFQDNTGVFWFRRRT